MFELKTISPDGIERALAKVERYRLLNEPWQAESICLDVLETDADNQKALVALLLSMTDQFHGQGGPSVSDVRKLLPRLSGDYEQEYYAGIICERKGTSLLRKATLGSGPVVYDWLRKAMTFYDRAGELRSAGNDDALLRWNTCARLIDRHPDLEAVQGSDRVTLLE